MDTLARNIDRWDTGSWSRYDLFPHRVVNVASSSYHVLHINQLRAMQLVCPREELEAAATRFEGGYATGREQARVALGGPKASLTFALALAACCLTPAPFALKEMLLAVALFNVVLGLVNLVPAYPLDGYKLVVGLLWSATGSEGKARRVVRRIAIGWAALEVPATMILLAEKPALLIGVYRL